MKTARSIAAFVALLFAMLISPSLLRAQPAANAGESHILTTPDGWPIHINYFVSAGGKEAPVVILFPGVEGKEKSMTRKVWSGVATALNKLGYAVVTADLRKHGDSVPDVEDSVLARLTKLTTSDYVLMATQDLETIKTFLLREHQSEKLNIRKLGIATAGSGCLVAAEFADFDWSKKPWPDAPLLAQRTPKGQDVRAILMLSPESSVRGLNSTAIIRSVADPSKGIAVHVWFNPAVRAEKASAEKVFRFLDLKNPALEEVRKLNEGPADPEGKFSAEGLLQGKARPVMEQHIADFFDKNLMKLESPWQTRTSRLE